MNYFVILRLPVNYETDYDLTDLDDIVQLKMFMRYDCQQMNIGPGDNTYNYDKWLSLHKASDPLLVTTEENFTTLVKSGLVELDDIHEVIECHDKLFENITSIENWCVSDADGSYSRCKVLDTIVGSTKYFAWHNMWNTYYTDSSTPSIGNDLYIFNDGTASSESTITELGSSFDEISKFTTELGTFTKLEDL